jgi:hypothetical protein
MIQPTMEPAMPATDVGFSDADLNLLDANLTSDQSSTREHAAIRPRRVPDSIAIGPERRISQFGCQQRSCAIHRAAYRQWAKLTSFFNSPMATMMHGGAPFTWGRACSSNGE